MNFEEAKEQAVKYLVRTLRTEMEVRNKLKKLNVDDEMIDDVVSYLKEISYIDDNNYANSYIRQCEKMPKYSKYEIKMKLSQKGIDKEIIDNAIGNLSYNYEAKIVEKLLKTKLKDMDELKQKAYLYRRGFKINNEF